MLMMRPQPRCFMAGRARRIRWNGADRLTASASSHRSGGNCSTGAKCRTTALFTRISIAPRRPSRPFIMVSIDARCVRSALTLMASTPWRADRRSLVSCGSIRSCRTTLAPAPARLSATASPRPAVAPVTRAHLSFSIGWGSSRLLPLIQLGEYFPCIAESIDAGRHAAIDRDLHEHLAYFLLCGAVGQRAPNMGLEFVRAVERAQHREVEKTAGLVRKAVAAPDIAPAIFRREVLHWTIEVVGRRDGLVDEFVAKDAFADLEASIVCRLVHDDFQCLRLQGGASSWARTAETAPVAAEIP